MDDDLMEVSVDTAGNETDSSRDIRCFFGLWLIPEVSAHPVKLSDNELREDLSLG